MVNKRKREELSDSDSDEITPGKQILPVANLPYDFNQEPQDGMQYLFLVRRDARRLPRITRVKNPYEVPEIKVAHTPVSLSANTLPCEEWRIAFQKHFSYLRENLTQATIHIDSHLGPRQRSLPEKKNRDAWWKFLTGYPESVWSPRERHAQKKLSTSCRMPVQARGDPAAAVFIGNVVPLPGAQSRDEYDHLLGTCFSDLPRNVLVSDVVGSAGSTDAAPFKVDFSVSEATEEGHVETLSPPEVTPSHLREIDHRMSIHLLMYFTHWINLHLQSSGNPLTTITVKHGQWIFALLTKIEDELSADEMSLLRNLARACLGLIQCYGGKDAKKDAMFEGDSGRAIAENGARMSDVSCWMVFTAIAGHWGQRDLWNDAATELTLA